MLLKLVIFLPLLSFLFCAILSRFITNINQNLIDRVTKYSSTGLLVISAILSLVIFVDTHQNQISQKILLSSWISSGDFIANWSLQLDSLTAAMLLVVTIVSSLVHLYSIGYMAQDKSISRFMAYLSLFTFFMLILVTGDNFLQLFVGWEGVGLASYLLIGFWFKKESANNAAMKAFIVNRVGDLGLIIAIALIYLIFGSIEYSEVFSSVSENHDQSLILFGIKVGIIDLISILLFIGAMGKSAQIILHVWLADAMEGPTPVSALIHAATMVTAGVFLVARCSPIFEYSQIALNLVTIIGATTAVFAATIALTQNDIKKIIAYSTCSQLGYMFFACGLSVYSAGIFHLVTHAFFKALLFLGAGSVIHAMHHEQDITKMGGIWKKIPVTYTMMWIGSLALAGFPPFAGFFSKDIIIEAAYMKDTPVANYAFYAGILAAFLTAFYSWRLIFLVFHGKSRVDKKTFDHAHESPLTMQVPLFILAIGSVVFGFVGYKFFHMVSMEDNFFSNSIFSFNSNHQLLEQIHQTPLLIKLLPLILGIIAILIAYILYVKNTEIPKILSRRLRYLYNISFNKWYFDEIYQHTLVDPTKKLGSTLWKIFDIKIVDGIPNGLASISKYLSSRVSAIQNGFIYSYSMWMILGVLTILLILMSSLKHIIAL